MQSLFYVTVHKGLANRRSVQTHFFKASCQFTLLNLLHFLSGVMFFGWFISTYLIYFIFSLQECNFWFTPFLFTPTFPRHDWGV